jgi:hypothetical protein
LIRVELLILVESATASRFSTFEFRSPGLARPLSLFCLIARSSFCHDSVSAAAVAGVDLLPSVGRRAVGDPRFSASSVLACSSVLSAQILPLVLRFFIEEESRLDSFRSPPWFFFTAADPKFASALFLVCVKEVVC